MIWKLALLWLALDFMLVLIWDRYAYHEEKP